MRRVDVTSERHDAVEHVCDNMGRNGLVGVEELVEAKPIHREYGDVVFELNCAERQTCVSKILHRLRKLRSARVVRERIEGNRPC